MTLYTSFEIQKFGANSSAGDYCSINISDLHGIIVKTMSGDLKARTSTFFWDRKDNQGNLLPNGLYIYSLDINQNNINTHKTGKLDVLK